MELFSLAACLLIKILGVGPSVNATKEDIREETTRLVKAFKKGDKSAFDKIVHFYQNKIYNLTLNYVKQTEEAKDLTQDVFVTLFRALPSLKDDRKFVAWMYQIAVNHCRNRYKRLQRRGFFSSYSIDDADNILQLPSGDLPEENAEHRDILNVILTTMETMSATEQEILQLRDIQELSYEEVSLILDIPLGTVKSKLNRARGKLKNKLKPLLNR